MGPQLKVVERTRTATMLCAASGNPDPEITWFKDFLPVDPSASNGRIKQLRSGKVSVRGWRIKTQIQLWRECSEVSEAEGGPVDVGSTAVHWGISFSSLLGLFLPREWLEHFFPSIPSSCPSLLCSWHKSQQGSWFLGRRHCNQSTCLLMMLFKLRGNWGLGRSWVFPPQPKTWVRKKKNLYSRQHRSPHVPGTGSTAKAASYCRSRIPLV